MARRKDEVGFGRRGDLPRSINRGVITRRDFLKGGEWGGGGRGGAVWGGGGARGPPTRAATAPMAATSTSGPEVGGLTGTVEVWMPETRDDAIASSQWWYNAFMAANPGVTVKSLNVPYGEDSVKLRAAHETDTAPDIMWVYGDFHFALGVDGLTQSTNDLLERIGIDRFPAGVLDGIRIAGTYYSVPFVGFPFVIFYRKDLYEEKGLKPAETHEELLANIRALHDPPNIYGYALTNQNIVDTWNLKSAMWTHGAYYFDAEDNLALDRPETLEAWAYYKELGKYTPPGAMSQSDLEMREYMIDGGVAHHMSTTSFPALFKEEDIERIGAHLYPIKAGAKGATLDFMGFAIAAKAKRPDLAKELIAFLMEPANFEEYLRRTIVGWIPMVQDAYTESYLNDPRIAPVREYFEVGAKAQKTGVVGTGYFGPSVKASVLVATDVEKSIGDRLVVLDQSPEEVLDFAISTLEAAL